MVSNSGTFILKLYNLYNTFFIILSQNSLFLVVSATYNVLYNGQNQTICAL
jgi:hypothetical protein